MEGGVIITIYHRKLFKGKLLLLLLPARPMMVRYFITSISYNSPYTCNGIFNAECVNALIFLSWKQSQCLGWIKFERLRFTRFLCLTILYTGIRSLLMPFTDRSSSSCCIISDHLEAADVEPSPRVDSLSNERRQHCEQRLSYDCCTTLFCRECSLVARHNHRRPSTDLAWPPAATMTTSQQRSSQSLP